MYSGASRSISSCGGCARSSASGSRGQVDGAVGGGAAVGVATRSAGPDAAAARRGGRVDAAGTWLVALARARQLERRLVLVGLAAVVGRDLVGVVLLPARVSFRELLVELARVEQDERRQLDRAGRRVDPSAVAGLDEQRQEPAVIEMGVGQQDRVELVRLVGERDPVPDRFVRAALEHPAVDQDPWPRSVTSRNCEPVTVVAPPRNWMCMGDMVTARRSARVSSVPMDIAAVEQSFGELLAALGDIVVARTRGAPADAAGGSTPRWRAATGGGGGASRSSSRMSMTARSIGEDARAFANMRGSLDWIDPMEPTPGLPTTGSAGRARRRTRERGAGRRPRSGGARPALW